MLELGVTFSYPQLIIDDSVVTVVKRAMQGIDVNDATLAVDIIKEVGPGGDFLGQKHTRKFLAAEQSIHKMIDRRTRGAWMSRGGYSMAERAARRAVEILDSHKPTPLPAEVLDEIGEIILRAGTS